MANEKTVTEVWSNGVVVINPPLNILSIVGESIPSSPLMWFWATFMMGCFSKLRYKSYDVYLDNLYSSTSIELECSRLAQIQVFTP
jgi:hypothetical protein